MPKFTMLALVGLIALLAACGQSGGSTGNPSGGATTAPATGATVADLKGRKIVIGTDASYPPFESVDKASNQVVGFDVDLMNAIAKLINIQPEFQNAGFDTIFAALQKKQFDAVMSAATITDERKKIVAFSDPYIEVGQLVVTLASNTTIKSYSDLPNAGAVGVQTGTTGETATLEKAKVPDAKVKRYQTIDLAFADLANNAIDAVVADGPTVGNYLSQSQYSGKLKIQGEAFTTESYGIAVPQSDTELARRDQRRAQATHERRHDSATQRQVYDQVVRNQEPGARTRISIFSDS